MIVTFVKNVLNHQIMKTSIKIFVGIIIALCAVIYYQNARLNAAMDDRDKYKHNFENAKFDIDSLQDANGNLVLKVSSLTVDKEELQKNNSSLSKTLNDMGLKIKNLQEVIDAKHEYEVKFDTIFLEKIDTSNNRFLISKEDEWMKMSGIIETIPTPSINNFSLSLKNDVVIATEFIYKRRWFLGCRRVVGVNVYTKSNNPYFKLSKMETYMADNKWNKKLR